MNRIIGYLWVSWLCIKGASSKGSVMWEVSCMIIIYYSRHFLLLKKSKRFGTIYTKSLYKGDQSYVLHYIIIFLIIHPISYFHIFKFLRTLLQQSSLKSCLFVDNEPKREYCLKDISVRYSVVCILCWVWESEVTFDRVHNTVCAICKISWWMLQQYLLFYFYSSIIVLVTLNQC